MKDSTCVYDLREIPLPIIRPEWKDTVLGDREITNKPDPTVALMWSAEFEPPAVGAPVKVRINNLGPGKVIGYFTEHGWLGVRVKLSQPPAWYIKQNKGLKDMGALVFGAEIDLA